MLNIQILISEISDTKIMFTFLILISLFLFYKKQNKNFLIVFFSTCTAMFATYSLKHILKIPRPENMLVFADGYRFPSGHATISAVICGLVIYFSSKHVKDKIHKYILYFIAILWCVLVSYSRLYLGVHMFIDVFTGALIGTLSVFGVIKIFHHLHYYKK